MGRTGVSPCSPALPKAACLAGEEQRGIKNLWPFLHSRAKRCPCFKWDHLGEPFLVLSI